MYVQNKKENCCGCTACMTICPAKCITMVQDEEGFLFPQIDETKCIHCGLCRRVCDFSKDHDWEALPEPKVYAAKQKSDKERAASQSGGMFAALSDAILEMGGVVYGAAYDADWTVIHKRAETKDERNAMRGSKYVQSDMRDNFRKVLQDLATGRTVLFSGTHCQCAGLKSLAEMRHIKMDKLFLVDIVCHGVPSPRVYKAFLNFMEKKHHGKIEKFNFRNKKYGWHNTVESTTITGKEYDTMLYRDLFYSDNALRTSCFACPYKKVLHNTDITIGDFWGIENWAEDFDDTKGISLMILNTTKGTWLFNKVQESLNVRQSKIIDCIQPCLQHPMEKPLMREQFWQDFETKPFTYVLQKYTDNYGWKTHTKKTCKKALKVIFPHVVIQGLKKIIGKQ